MEIFYEINFRTVGARIREARKALDLTQEKAAEHAFISGQFWSLIETGRMRASINTYCQIAAVLGMTLNDIFYDNAAASLPHKAFSKEALLSGCTVFEKAIISETVLALKKVLERNRTT